MWYSFDVAFIGSFSYDIGSLLSSVTCDGLCPSELFSLPFKRDYNLNKAKQLRISRCPYIIHYFAIAGVAFCDLVLLVARMFSLVGY